jgi:hypothetical protein
MGIIPSGPQYLVALKPLASDLFKQEGVDVYLLTPDARTAAIDKPIAVPPPPGGRSAFPFDVSVLIVYQDEAARQKELKVLASSGGVRWYGDDGLTNLGYQVDWNSAVSFKYEVLTFRWYSRKDVALIQLTAYVPPECVTRGVVTKAAAVAAGAPAACTRTTNDHNSVGEYDAPSPPVTMMNHTGVWYEAATLAPRGLWPE